MGKILFWAVVVVVALVAVRILATHNRKKNMPEQAAPQTNIGNKTANSASESMVRCAHCGIHMPRSEAVLSAGKTWCSAEHAKLGVRP